MRRIATPLTMLVLGLGLGLGAVAVADPGARDATVNRTARAAQSDPVVRELREIRGRLDLINRNLTGYQYIAPKPSIQALLTDIKRNTDIR